ncbi:phosphatase PAP2 family protein [Roseibium sp. RKSG952]|uniref:phosphatase PAP2 family protein n=1 Tax=Roseibium sp. RKSG952 TaxID=2529384 RepID=UPI0012BB6DE4|nr:phosphatase PAP2 family protein [Roseibium sp. RKSG952]MTH98213.1 phosphatase PAP2 family protein [Roseibium sp. RKSG952]
MTRALENNNKSLSALYKTWGWAAAHPVLAVCGYIVVVSVFFLVFPKVDLWASGLFYVEGKGFVAKDVPILREFRHLGPYLIKIAAIVSVAIMLLKLLLPARSPLVPLRTPVFLVSTLILGPGILVNAILKDNWGRPRPNSVEVFGGTAHYQDVWVMSDQCASNCSFVSGEASGSMWLVALAFVAPLAWRAAILWFVLPLGFLLSLNRIAFGGHFLSDTLLSWGLTLLVLLFVHRLLYRTGARAIDDTRLDVWFTKAGRGLQRWTGRAAAAASRAAIRFKNRFSKAS